MLFSSIEFAFFLPIVFLIYWAIGYAHIKDTLKLRLQNAFVVIASYIFYGWWDWRFLLLIAFTSFCSWGSGLLICRVTSQNKAKAWTATNIVINLAILAIYNRQIKKSAFAKQKVHNFKLKSAPFLYAFYDVSNAIKTPFKCSM